MLAIWKRELQSYFYTPVGYAFMGVFLALSGTFFYMLILGSRSSDVLTFLGQLSYLWMLLSPVLTMRLLAEEKQKRTDQLLLTSPVSLPGIVLGKYLAAFTVMICTVLLTLIYVPIIAMYGAVYPSELLVGYLGFILQGERVPCAGPLHFRSAPPTQVTAAVTAFGGQPGPVAPRPAGRRRDPERGCGMRCSFFSLYHRYNPFLMGQLILRQHRL